MAAQVLQTALGYWHHLVSEVYASASRGPADADEGSAVGRCGALGPGQQELYTDLLENLRALLLARMARAEQARTCCVHPACKKLPGCMRPCFSPFDSSQV